MTQSERVLAAAKSFRGTCQADWLGETPDGGPRITRVAARIQDLENAGHVFEIIGVRSKTRVYRLVELERPVLPAPRESRMLADGPLEDRLFEVGRGQHGWADQEKVA